MNLRKLYNITVVIAATAAMSSCSHLSNPENLVHANSFETVTGARNIGQVNSFTIENKSNMHVYDNIISYATENEWKVINSSEDEGKILLRGVPMGVDTTHVGIFVSTNEQTTTVDVASYSLMARREVYRLLSQNFGIKHLR